MEKKLKAFLYETIFEAETKLGKYFDLGLILTIIASIIVVALDSVNELKIQYNNIFLSLEWYFTIAFTIEYLLRIYSFPNRLRYIFSFYGLIDLISILPIYLSLASLSS